MPKTARGTLRGVAAAVALAAVLAAVGWVLFRNGIARFAYPSRAEFPVHGVDASHHQGPVDWARVRAAGYDFAYLKATEGQTYRDSTYLRNRDQARRAGLVTGPYHFFTFCTPARAQALNLLAVQPGDAGPSLPPALDLEFGGNCAARPPRDSVLAEVGRFLAIVDSAFGRKTVLYITREFYDAYLGGAADRPVWARDIYRRPRFVREWTFWQYAANGRVPGVSGIVDLNAFHGSRAAFDSLVRRPPSPSSPP